MSRVGDGTTIFQSGYGGITSGGITSGGITSGAGLPLDPNEVSVFRRCYRCSMSVGYGAELVSVLGCSGFYENWCWKCAGYSYENRTFQTKQIVLTEVAGFVSGAEPKIVADWYSDKGMEEAAQYLRNIPES